MEINEFVSYLKDSSRYKVLIDNTFFSCRLCVILTLFIFHVRI